MCGGNRKVLALIPLLVASARGQCYLEDASATCTVCWTTNSAGVTKGGECPTGSVEVIWTQAPPGEMTAGQGYRTQYEFKLDRTVFPVVLKEAKGQDVMVPHSNIHSCVRSRGACTPFVGNTPGLATHTAALIGNLSTVDGHYLLDTFATEMNLMVGSYTVIAHTRFFIPDSGQDATQSCYPNCLTKVDTAAGILREVVEAEVSTSTDAYVGTGILGGCMLISGLSVLWGVRSGKLNLATILEALTRDEIVLVVDLIIGVGDVAAFTIGFVQEVIVDPNLIDIIPAATLFLCTGWIASIAAAIQNLIQLKVVMQKRWNADKYMHHQGESLVRQVTRGSDGRRGSMGSGGSAKSASSGRRSSRSSLCGSDRGVQEEEDADISTEEAEARRQRQKSLHKLKTSKIGRDMITDAERNSGHMWNLYMSTVTLIFSDIPLTAVGVFIVLKADGLEIAVVAALCASTVMVGAKAHALTSFAEQRKKARLAKKKIFDFVSEEEESGKRGDSDAKDPEAGIEPAPNGISNDGMAKDPEAGIEPAPNGISDDGMAKDPEAGIEPAPEQPQKRRLHLGEETAAQWRESTQEEQGPNQALGA